MRKNRASLMPFVVGIELIFGLSMDILLQIYSHFHPWIKPLFSSSLTLATALAILHSQLFGLGARKAEWKIPSTPWKETWRTSEPVHQLLTYRARP